MPSARKVILFLVMVALVLGGFLFQKHRKPVVALGSDKHVALREVVSGLTSPTHIVGDPSRDRLYVLQQAGVVSIVEGGRISGEFINVSGRIRAGGEMGLLGLALHPDFPKNGKFYLNYTAEDPTLRTVVSEFRLNPETGLGDLNSERPLLSIQQPYTNHNGGLVAFGPDGMLYIGMGDGGSREDPQGNGQNPRALLGKILRIDVNGSRDGKPYAIPADNPFANGLDGAPEVWAWGMRNPWRFSFDRKTGELWAADVGQDTLEEIDIIRRGQNYGWAVYEGTLCQKKADCQSRPFVAPVHVYGREEGVCVTGGFVYRGKSFPSLDGLYLYGDFGSGNIWALRREGGKVLQNDLVLKSSLNISTFGEDRNGEIYLASYAEGKIFQLVVE